MTAANRLNLLLSDILQSEPSSTNEIYSGSLNQTSPLLTFAEEDYHAVIKAPLPPRRTTSSLKRRRQRQYIHQTDKQNQQSTQPLLNSSTLDDLFRALTLECEQYLSASSTPAYQNKIYGPLIVQPSTTTNVDSNDDDYENLHPLSNGLASLKTSIQIVSPEERHVVSVSVSSKTSSSPIFSSSRTYPLLSTSYPTPSMIPTNICHSSEEDSIDLSSSSTIRRRRRRIRKQQQQPPQLISSTNRSSSSDDERTETINEKKPTLSKRSCSTDYRHQRIQSIYDNHPISLSSQKHPPSRRTRRRDISLQQHASISTKHHKDTSPLSVLLTSTQSTSDFLDRSEQRPSRIELVDHQPLSLLDRMHQQFYRTSPTGQNNIIPTQRIPTYPVY